MKPATKEEIIDAIKVSLGEWGFRRSKGEEYAAFYDKAIQSALNEHRERNSSSDNTELQLQVQPLPENLTQAFQHILDHEFMGNDRCNVIIDRINNEFPNIQGTPFYRNKYNQSYSRTKQFDPFKPSELDPFSRFVTYKFPTSLFMFGILDDD